MPSEGSEWSVEIPPPPQESPRRVIGLRYLQIQISPIWKILDPPQCWPTLSE